MRSPIKSLYPKKEIFDRFSYKEQKKLGNLIIGNVICISLFVLTTIFMFITGNRIASGLTLISDIAFIVSAVIAKKGVIYKASWLATVGYAIACGVVAFFMSTDISMHIGYRVFGFCMVMVILNFMIALKPSQILVFY